MNATGKDSPMSCSEIILAFLMLFSSVTGIAGRFSSEVAAVPLSCVDPAPQKDNIEKALAIGAGVFAPERWEEEITEYPYIVAVTWIDNQSLSLAYTQLLIYDCGYSWEDLEAFYGEDGIAVILGNYESYTQTAECERDGLMLREYDVDSDGRPYKIRYWIQPLNETRVRDMHLSVSEDDPDLLDEYAKLLYPQLPTCGRDS
jgi:hypothetical protein